MPLHMLHGVKSFAAPAKNPQITTFYQIKTCDNYFYIMIKAISSYSSDEWKYVRKLESLVYIGE